MADGGFGATFYKSATEWTEIVTSMVYNDGTWHYAAAVLRSGLAEIYVDGILVAQDNSNPIASVRSSTQTTVGRIASEFVGDIDEVRVYNRALNESEIASLARIASVALTDSSGVVVRSVEPTIRVDTTPPMTSEPSRRTRIDNKRVIQLSPIGIGGGVTALRASIRSIDVAFNLNMILHLVERKSLERPSSEVELTEGMPMPSRAPTPSITSSG